MTNNDTTAIYLRISKDDNSADESESIVNQRGILLDYIQKSADLRDTKIIELSDDGFSGSNFNRPGVKHLLDLARKRQVQNILVKDFSRFGREYIQVGDYLEQIFPFLGIRFISVSDNYDSVRPDCGAGNINAAFKHIMHSYYVKDLSQKIRSARRTHMMQGDFISPYAIFGYKKSENKYKLEIDEPAAAIVRRMFALIIQGFSTTQSARILNSEGVPTPNVYKQMNGCTRNWNMITDRNHWTEDILFNIVTDIRYTGCVVGGKTMCIEPGSNKMKSLPKDKWYIRENMHEAIISPDDFDKARKCICMKPNNGDFTSCNRASSVFSRKVICASCGHALKKAANRAGMYYCRYSVTSQLGQCFSPPISKNELESAVIAALQVQLDILTEEERLAKLSRRNNEINKKAISDQIRLYNKQLDKLKSSRCSIYEKYADGLISKEDYLSQRGACELQIAAVSDKLNETEQAMKSEEQSAENPMLALLSSIKTEDGQLNKQVFDALVEKILVYDNSRIEIVWKFNNQIESTDHQDM